MKLPAMLSALTLFLAAAYCPPAIQANDADWYVAPQGSDQAPGTQEEPFATVGRAQTAVREAIREGLKRDVTVLVRGGTYFLKEPLTFGPDDAGSAEHSVTYAAFPGERPIFSGGRLITGWVEKQDGRWSVPLPEVAAGRWYFRQLFVNGDRQRRARDPNEGFHRIVAAGEDDRTSFQYAEGDVRPYANLGDAEIVFLHDWSISRVGISKVDEETTTVTFTDPIGSRGHNFFRISGFERHPRYYVEHALELLDAPGEWYLDRRAGTLTLQPPEGVVLNRVEVVAPVLEQLLIVRGDPERGRPVQNLRFVGLTFAHAAAPSTPSGYAGIQAGFHEPRSTDSDGYRWTRMPAAVIFDAASGCRLEEGRIAHVGGTAVSLQGNSANNRIVGNEIVDAGGNGVMAGEPTILSEQTARGNVVANNHIHRCGALYHGCVGVWVGITDGTVIAHNELHDLPYSGISVGWMWNTTPTPCQNNIIESNHIHHIMQVLSDGGGIYTLGRQPGTVLRGNLIHDVAINAGRAESNGLFIDEGSSEILIEGNTIYNIARSPIRFHKAENNTVRGNVLVTSGETPPFRFNATKEGSMTYDANVTPDPASWTPPSPVETKAGLEPSYRARLSDERNEP